MIKSFGNKRVNLISYKRETDYILRFMTPSNNTKQTTKPTGEFTSPTFVPAKLSPFV